MSEPRLVVWKLDRVISKLNGTVSIVESAENARKSGENYIQKLKDEGEEVLSVDEFGGKLYITLK